MAVRVMSLLLVVVVVAVVIAAAAMTASARVEDDCGQTIAQATDKACADKLVRAVNTGNHDLVSIYCCGVLACVRELSCLPVLSGICGNDWAGRCDPPPATAAAIDGNSS